MGDKEDNVLTISLLKAAIPSTPQLLFILVEVSITRMIRFPPPLVPKNLAPPLPSPKPPIPKPSPKPLPKASDSVGTVTSGNITEEALVAVINGEIGLEGGDGFSFVTFLAKDFFSICCVEF